jgi:hypothetical protein
MRAREVMTHLFAFLLMLRSPRGSVARQPLLANSTQIFMGGAALFLAQFFPLFLLGGVRQAPAKLFGDGTGFSLAYRYSPNSRPPHEREGKRHAHSCGAFNGSDRFPLNRPGRQFTDIWDGEIKAFLP